MTLLRLNEKITTRSGRRAPTKAQFAETQKEPFPYALFSCQRQRRHALVTRLSSYMITCSITKTTDGLLREPMTEKKTRL